MRPPAEADRIDEVLADWAEERPDLDSGAMEIALRIQTLAKTLAGRVAEELSTLDVEWWEYDVLSILRRQGKPYRMAAMEITKNTMLSPGAMTNRIDRLLERGFVERIEDASDRRRVLVQLSRKGLSLIDRATESRFASAESASRGLSEAQRKTLGQLLRKMALSGSAESRAATNYPSGIQRTGP